MAAARWSESDKRFLFFARRLARKAAGRTSPNPMVGAVLVRGGKVVGAGYHRIAGGDHAEIIALKQAGAKAKGATLYITLEPCNHQGRTPPCTAALIGAGVKEVVAAMTDPNPLVAGAGLQRLRRAGIKVRLGLYQAECRELLEAFAKFITRRQPFVTLKLAATLDGKIATANGDSRWVSGAISRQLVHRWRNEADAVLVGVGTVRTDDPQLTCRIAGGRNPYRVILDSRLSLPLTAQILRLKDAAKTIVVTTNKAPARKARAMAAAGVTVWHLAAVRDGRVAWQPLLRKLADFGIVSVLIEGGAAIAASALGAKVVDKIEFFYAPKIVGGDGRAMIGALAIGKMAQAIELKKMTIRKSGTDVRLTGYF